MNIFTVIVVIVGWQQFEMTRNDDLSNFNGNNNIRRVENMALGRHVPVYVWNK